MGQGVLAASSASGASTFVAPEDAIHAKALSRASALGSDGQNVSVGRCVAKCTMWSPVPLAISRTSPFGGRTARKTSRMGPRLRAAAAEKRRLSFILLINASGETLTVGALSYPRISRSARRGHATTRLRINAFWTQLSFTANAFSHCLTYSGDSLLHSDSTVGLFGRACLCFFE